MDSWLGVGTPVRLENGKGAFPRNTQPPILGSRYPSRASRCHHRSESVLLPRHWLHEGESSDRMSPAPE